jgi:hypothetical protein
LIEQFIHSKTRAVRDGGTRATEEDVEISPPKETVPISSKKAGLSDAADNPSNLSLIRAMTETTLNDRLAANSPELTPSISEDDPDFIGSLPMFRQRSGTSSGKGRRSLSHAASEPRAFPPSPRVSGEGSMELKNIHSSPGTTTIEEVPENTKDSKNPVVDAVTEAMKELWESKRSSQDHSDILVEMKYINRIRT